MVKTEELAIGKKVELDWMLISLGDDIRCAVQRANDGKTYVCRFMPYFDLSSSC